MGDVAAQPAAVPHFVGRYEVLVPIASGGMATVYLARSRGAGGFEREVALKLTHTHLRESQDFQSLLLEEAKLASAIRHHNVVSVLDVGDDPFGLFLVMDYVEGDTLSGLMRRARSGNESLPQPIAMRALLDALAGLHAAHDTKDASGKSLDLVHRDFSPQNILVGTDGIAKLTDFGIAKAASRAGHTTTGILKGKVAYMAPEQARALPLDRRADVWAAGVLAWEIVAGRPLWPRNVEDVATLIRLVTELPPRLRSVDSGVSEALDDTVARALSMDPAERWPTAAAFARALASATPRAETEEVAEYVRVAAGPKIAQRREQVRAMEELRAKMGEISEASQLTPSGSYPRAALPSVGGETDTIEVLSGASKVTPAMNAPPRWAVPIVIGAVALGTVILVGAQLARSHRTDAPTFPPTPPPMTATTPAETQRTAPVPADSSPPAIEVTSLPQTIASKPIVHTAPVPTHASEAKTGSKTKLAPSPY